MIIKFVCILFLLHGCLLSNAQLILPKRELAPRTFIAFVSPITTELQMQILQQKLIDAEFDFELGSLEYSTAGRLRSFFVQFSSRCDESPFTYKGNTDFSEKNSFPLAVIMTSDNCSTGVFTTTYENMDMMFHAFFKERNPAHVLFTWDGDLETVKDVVWSNE